MGQPIPSPPPGPPARGARPHCPWTALPGVAPMASPPETRPGPPPRPTAKARATPTARALPRPLAPAPKALAPPPPARGKPTAPRRCPPLPGRPPPGAAPWRQPVSPPPRATATPTARARPTARTEAAAMGRRRHALLLALLLAAIPAWGDTIYKWVDEGGVTHYSQTSPPGRQAREVQLPQAPPPAPAEAGTREEWRQRDAEFQQRWREKQAAEAQEQARRQREGAQQEERCHQAREQLSRLMASKPALKRRPTTSLRDPATGAEVELMNNAERSRRIAQAEEDVRQYCK